MSRLHIASAISRRTICNRSSHVARSAQLVALVFVVATSGCSRLIPGYEVLSVPQPIDIYQAGKPWTPGVGPSGTALADTITGAGAAELTAKEESTAQMKIAGVFKEWVTAALGLGNNSVKTLNISRLQHEVVRDVRDVKESTPLLWEAIIVDSMSLELSDGASHDISAEGIGTKLTQAIGGSVTFTASGTSTSSYTVRADKPVVAAIRITDLSYKTSPESGAASLSLETNAVGTPQVARFGYQVLLQEPVDPIRHTATLRIQNATLPQFAGITHRFVKNDTWISEKRTITAGSDRAMKHAHSVWDTLSIVWSPVLADCQINCVRQYLILRPMDSELKGTH